jgi:hypothetical protein
MCAEILWRPLLTGSPAPALTAKLLSLSPAIRTAYAWNPASSYPSQMRVLSGGKLDVQTLKTEPGQPPEELSPVILTEFQKREWSTTNYVFEAAAFARPKWTGQDYRDLLYGANPADVFARLQSPFYIALHRLRKDGPKHDAPVPIQDGPSADKDSRRN